jgi:hypothetical protein
MGSQSRLEVDPALVRKSDWWREQLGSTAVDELMDCGR